MHTPLDHVIVFITMHPSDSGEDHVVPVNRHPSETGGEHGALMVCTINAHDIRDRTGDRKIVCVDTEFRSESFRFSPIESRTRLDVVAISTGSSFSEYTQIPMSNRTRNLLRCRHPSDKHHSPKSSRAGDSQHCFEGYHHTDTTFFYG